MDLAVTVHLHPSLLFFYNVMLIVTNHDYDDDDDKNVQYDVCEDERGCDNL